MAYEGDDYLDKSHLIGLFSGKLIEQNGRRAPPSNVPNHIAVGLLTVGMLDVD